MTATIGLVGCGRWGKLILRDLKQIGCRVVVAVRSEEGRANAAEFGADQIVDAATALPRGIGGFVVAVPTALHLDIVRDLLPRGRPIFVEKPLSGDIKAARAMLGQMAGSVFVMHKWRYHPAVEELRRIAASEEFGPVLGLLSERVQWGSPHSDVDPVWILAPHDLSIATHVLGAVPQAVAASTDPYGLPGHSLRATMIHPQTGARVEFRVSANEPEARREIRLACRDALIRLSGDDYATLKIHRWSDGDRPRGEPVVREVEREMPLLAELRAFVAHLRGGPAPLSPVNEELAMLEQLARLRRMAGIDDEATPPEMGGAG